jgi:UDP-glucose 4-epimerase
LLEGKPFEVWGGEQLRDFSYVDDAVDALLLTAVSDEANGQIYNLGDREVVSLQEVAQLLVDVNGGGEFVVRTYPADRKRIDIGDYYADYSKINQAVGWEPKVRLREGLAKTLDFIGTIYKTIWITNKTTHDKSSQNCPGKSSCQLFSP